MLKIYKNKTPNVHGGLHYLYNNFNNFLTELGTPYLEFELRDYRINNDVIELNTQTINADVDSITYAIETDGVYHRCYFVDSAIKQSNKCILSVSIDLWGSYIDKAVFSKQKVSRCNRNVGIGVYDNIECTKSFSGVTGYESMNPSATFTINDMAIVFVVAFTTGVSSIIQNNSATKLAVYGKDFSSITPPTGVSKIDYVIDKIGGIYGVTTTGGSNDANVLKAYLVPKFSFFVKSGSLPSFKSRGFYDAQDVTPDYEIAPSILGMNFNKTIDVNYEYYVGTKTAGLKLIRTTEPQIAIRYEFIATQDSMQVMVRQGGQMLDITSAFEVGLTSNDGNFTTAQRIQRTLQSLTSFVSGVQQASSGVAIGGAIQVTNAITGLIQYGNARYSQGGDGVATFRTNTGDVQYPFYCVKFESTDDESANANLIGASFNQRIDSFADVFSAPLLGTGTSDTFVAMTCQIDNVNTNAREWIRSQLNEGIYVKQL